MTKQYLDPKESLGVEPDADRNVERMTPCCLDVRPKNSYLMGRGRGGGAWWMIWLGMMCVVLGFPMSFYDGDIEKGIPAFLGLCAIGIGGFGLSLLWPIHIWKNQLPMRFNRKTRKVYFHLKGNTYIEKWDELRAYLKIQHGVTAMGAPLRDPQINIEFHGDDGSTLFTVFLMGVDRISLPTDQQAPAFWEYIRRYMEEGPKGLPEPNLGVWKPLDLNGLYLQNTPFPIFKSKAKWVWPFEILFFFPLRFIWFSISYPTELIYYVVEKHVKTKPFPPDMEAPCRCEQ